MDISQIQARASNLEEQRQMQESQNRASEASQIDPKHRDPDVEVLRPPIQLEFQVDDWVFLKISLMKGVMRFGKKGKLSLRYIGPYRMIKGIGQVAYELELVTELESVHPVFHVSKLRKCIRDPSRVVPIDDVQSTEDLSCDEVPVTILDRQVCKQRTKEVASLKVLWWIKNVEQKIGEAEEEMKSKCPHLFSAEGSTCV
ncbi:uncharacterized protein LOC132066521 [Lycium ferocissimum]|uniref:uncharacterized protein LOC132066521 n=1 Tax=Lycium ferocissimum TaxID=112874 RepID=UPI002815B199|nr:uncharacterized protein LOC132066521 [Lycium ferocissimum]